MARAGFPRGQRLSAPLLLWGGAEVRSSELRRGGAASAARGDPTRTARVAISVPDPNETTSAVHRRRKDRATCRGLSRSSFSFLLPRQRLRLEDGVDAGEVEALALASLGKAALFATAVVEPEALEDAGYLDARARDRSCVDRSWIPRFLRGCGSRGDCRAAMVDDGGEGRIRPDRSLVFRTPRAEH